MPPDINDLMPEEKEGPIQQEQELQNEQDIPDIDQNVHLVDQNFNNPVNRAGGPLIDAIQEEVKEAGSSDEEELTDAQIDRLMSSAHDSEQEQEDEQRREELLTRKNVSGAYVSRLIFRKAKQVGKPVIFD